jgi:hypothetical protein
MTNLLVEVIKSFTFQLFTDNLYFLNVHLRFLIKKMKDKDVNVLNTKIISTTNEKLN